MRRRCTSAVKHIVVFVDGLLLDDDALHVPGVMDRVEQIVRSVYGEDGVGMMYDPKPTDPVLKLQVTLTFEWAEQEGEDHGKGSTSDSAG